MDAWAVAVTVGIPLAVSAYIVADLHRIGKMEGKKSRDSKGEEYLIDNTRYILQEYWKRFKSR